ncbi:MAG: hypothetical protein JO300_11700 [Silvibacterium sp.]|nr:hypothetical protein [Silvibacterium sp.]MBV8438120.1 hypothetical protein [Silvibacterium sp.]
MAEPIRKDVTTADLAGRRGDYADNPDLATEEQNQNTRGPLLVQNDTPNPDVRNEAAPIQETAPLFKENEINDFRSRWGSVQTEFVDDPRRAVQEADQLVATVMQRLAEGFANERTSLEKQWDRTDNVSTEDLRVALQRYRTFFGRLLNTA